MSHGRVNGLHHARVRSWPYSTESQDYSQLQPEKPHRRDDPSPAPDFISAAPRRSTPGAQFGGSREIAGPLLVSRAVPQDGEKLERVARASDARWVLWRNGEASPFFDAELLFDDARTFAASRQRLHFRGWKNAVIPTAPFRTLQAGEATRVLAPLSGSILVDRKKVIGLGIPRFSGRWDDFVLEGSRGRMALL